MIGGVALAILCGALAAYVALELAREHQFHGGVENASKAIWAAAWDASGAFVQFAIPILLIVGIIPTLVLRLSARGNGDA